MSNLNTHIFLLILPMVLANTCHMLFVKKDWLAFLSIPISTKTFGQNKTIRGFIVLPVFGGFWAFVFSYAFGPFVDSYAVDAGIGVGLGVVYLLSELPNSFIKRRLGIANGQHSEKYKWLQMLVDKMDSLIGMILFYYFVTPIGIYDSIVLLFLSLAISIGVSSLLVLLKIKKSF